MNGAEPRFAHMAPRLAEPGIPLVSVVRKISQYRRHDLLRRSISPRISEGIPRVELREQKEDEGKKEDEKEE